MHTHLAQLMSRLAAHPALCSLPSLHGVWTGLLSEPSLPDTTRALLWEKCPVLFALNLPAIIARYAVWVVQSGGYHCQLWCLGGVISVVSSCYFNRPCAILSQLHGRGLCRPCRTGDADGSQTRAVLYDAPGTTSTPCMPKEMYPSTCEIYAHVYARGMYPSTCRDVCSSPEPGTLQSSYASHAH